MAGEICILAGGLSRRMGRDKARLRLHGKTMLRRIQDTAAQTQWPVRVIRRDLVARCGPLGGIYTAMKTTEADTVLFLACDMPFVTVAILQKLIRAPAPGTRAVFTRDSEDGAAGFPFVLRCRLVGVVEKLLAGPDFSIQNLAQRCRAKFLIASQAGPALFNVNTPNDWVAARLSLKSRAQD